MFNFYKIIISLIIKYLIILLIFAQTTLFAQTDSVLFQIKNRKVLKINKNLKVIHIKNFNNSNIYCKLFFDVPPHLQAEFKGINFISCRLLAAGKSTKQNSMNFSGGENYIDIKSTGNIDSTIKYLASSILNPEFSEREFNKILDAKVKKSFPPEISPRIYVKSKAENMLYGNKHPYGENYSEENLPELTSEDCEKYMNDYLLNSNKFLVIAANVSSDKIYDACKKYFKNIKLSKPSSARISDAKLPKHTMLNFYEIDEKIAEKNIYLSLLYPVKLKMNNKDYYKILVLNKALGAHKTGRLFKKLKTKYKLVDNVFSELKAEELAAKFEITVIFSHEKLYKVVNKIIREHKRIIEHKIYQSELETGIDLCIKDFLKSMKNNEKIAEIIFNIEKKKIPEEYYISFLDKIKLVTIDDIRQTAKKYLRTDKYTIAVIGENKKIRNEFLKLAVKAEINTYEDDTKIANIPYGFGASVIIEKFLETVKAEKKPKNQTIKIRTVYDFGNRTKIINHKILRQENNYKSIVRLERDTINSYLIKKEIVNKKDIALITSRGITVEDSSELAQVKTNSYQFPELEYPENPSVKIQLLGIFDIDDVQTYKVLVRYPMTAKYRHDYYDMETSMKIKSEELDRDGDNFYIISTTDFSDYEEVPETKGKIISYKRKLVSEGLSIEFEIISVDYKTKIDKREFIIPIK